MSALMMTIAVTPVAVECLERYEAARATLRAIEAPGHSATDAQMREWRSARHAAEIECDTAAQVLATLLASAMRHEIDSRRAAE